MFYILTFFLLITIFLYRVVRKVSRHKFNKLIEFKEI
jgi:hypothetical protein